VYFKQYEYSRLHHRVYHLTTNDIMRHQQRRRHSRQEAAYPLSKFAKKAAVGSSLTFLNGHQVLWFNFLFVCCDSLSSEDVSCPNSVPHSSRGTSRPRPNSSQRWGFSGEARAPPPPPPPLPVLLPSPFDELSFLSFLK
jgi:hypothetical protein